MLSIRRLLVILLIAFSISAVFLVIDYRGSEKETISTANDHFQTRALTYSSETASGRGYSFTLVSSDPESKVLENISECFADYKLSYETSNRVARFGSDTDHIYVFCEDNISRSADMTQLASFIQKGGRVVFAAGIAEGNEESYLNAPLGLLSKSVRTEMNDFVFSDGFLPFQESEMHYNGFNASAPIQLQDKARIYVSSKDSGWAVVYSYPYGAGKSLVINGSLLEDESCIGLLTALLSNELDGFAYPVLGVKLVFLDNFPIVTYVTDEICLREYGRRVDDFVQNIIWPRFQAASIQNEIVYTSSILTLGTEGTFFPGLNNSIFYNMGRSALLYGGELVGGSDISNGGALVRNDAFFERFSEAFPNYRITGMAVMDGQLPPVDSIGEDIRVIRGHLSGDEDSMFLCRAHASDGRYYFPVVSEGLDLDGGTLFRICMNASSLGVLSHTINMNELIIDEQQQPIWDHQKPLFEKFVSRVVSKVGWMKAATLSDTAAYIDGYENLRYTSALDDGVLTISCQVMMAGQAFMLHLSEDVKRVEGAEVEKLGMGYYLIRADQPQIKIYF